LLVEDALDLGLLIQLRGTGRRSDKALIQLEQHLGAGAPRHRRDRRRLHSVPLADRYDFLALEIHVHHLPSTTIVSGIAS
jgi:hypothetical protein